MAKESEVMGFVRSELAYASGGRFYGLVNAFQRLDVSIEAAREHAQQRYITGSGDQIKTSVLPNQAATWAVNAIDCCINATTGLT